MIDRTLTALGSLLFPGGDNPAARIALERAVEQFFGTGAAVAFWKGRIALYAILRAMGIGAGDEVILPGYTCVMVPGPVIYAGATPVYADIDAQTYNLRPGEVERLITPRARAIFVQHTYGIPAPVAEIRRLADARGIAVIEDCCHTFGGRLDGKLLGTFGDAAFFSGQWNKPFSTGLCGIALLRDAAVVERVRAEQESYPLPSRKAAFMLAAQLLVYEMCIYPRTTALATRLFRWLTKKGAVVGSSSKAEFERTLPAGYALRPAPVQMKLARLEVGRVAANMSHRKRVAQRYREALPAMGYALPPESPAWDAPLLRFPLRVANKDEALARAARHGVEIGSWFECPLHPIETDQAQFGYRDGMCPVAERAAREVINLPTHRRVRSGDVERTLRFVREVCRPAPPA